MLQLERTSAERRNLFLYLQSFRTVTLLFSVSSGKLELWLEAAVGVLLKDSKDCFDYEQVFEFTFIAKTWHSSVQVQSEFRKSRRFF